MLLERERYLRQLSDLLPGARHGRGRVAMVVGEAGVGKTSLVDAFCDSAPTAVRVLWGTCDPIRPSRPFAPIADIADRVGGDLRRAVSSGHRDGVLGAFLSVLRRPDGPTTIIVLDDLHWADDATLDLLRVVARRVAWMPALLVGLYRDHDVEKDHQLRLAIGDIPTSVLTEIHLSPLSVDAVERMAGGRFDPKALHRLTGGNPFFVKELLASGKSGRAGSDDLVPTTVRDAVLTRLSRLSVAAQQVIRAAAVLGPGTGVRIVLDVAEGSRDGLDDGVAHGLLELEDGAVSFRHELARRAVLDALPRDEVKRLNRAALIVLRAPTSIDWPRLARHAIASGDADDVLESAPLAGDAAAALGAHREAAEFYAAAIEHAHALEPSKRADLLERYARQASITDQIPQAIEAQRNALDTWGSVGDRRRLGVCLTDLSGMLWLAGSTDEAVSTAVAATEVLETVAPETRDLAWAWAVVAQRLLVSGGDEHETIAIATRAIDLAERAGDERVAIHAITTVAVTRIYQGEESGWALLEEVVTRARGTRFAEETVRAMMNLAEAARDFRRYDLAARWLAETSAYLDEHHFDLFDHILRSRLAALELEAGRWDAALADANALLESRAVANPLRVRALTVRGLVRARRGEPGATSDLDEALSLENVEPQDILPLRAARSEAAYLVGDEAGARGEAERGLAVGPRELSRWWWSELAFWGWKAGASAPLPHVNERPYWLHANGALREAANAWQAIGAPYQQAFALADSDAEPDLRRALRIFNDLGARVMANRVRAKLRSLGAARIDRGPRPRTRANPAQLTVREVEVLDLLGGGIGNADIAERLFISTKTVDHHVSAILRKLGVADRGAAIVEARRLGLAVQGRNMGTAWPQDGERDRSARS